MCAEKDLYVTIVTVFSSFDSFFTEVSYHSILSSCGDKMTNAPKQPCRPLHVTILCRASVMFI